MNKIELMEEVYKKLKEANRPYRLEENGVEEEKENSSTTYNVSKWFLFSLVWFDYVSVAVMCIIAGAHKILAFFPLPDLWVVVIITVLSLIEIILFSSFESTFLMSMFKLNSKNTIRSTDVTLDEKTFDLLSKINAELLLFLENCDNEAQMKEALFYFESALYFNYNVLLIKEKYKEEFKESRTAKIFGLIIISLSLLMSSISGYFYLSAILVSLFGLAFASSAGGAVIIVCAILTYCVNTYATRGKSLINLVSPELAQSNVFREKIKDFNGIEKIILQNEKIEPSPTYKIIPLKEEWTNLTTDAVNQNKQTNSTTINDKLKRMKTKIFTSSTLFKNIIPLPNINQDAPEGYVPAH